MVVLHVVWMWWRHTAQILKNYGAPMHTKQLGESLQVTISGFHQSLERGKDMTLWVRYEDYCDVKWNCLWKRQSVLWEMKSSKAKRLQYGTSTTSCTASRAPSPGLLIHLHNVQSKTSSRLEQRDTDSTYLYEFLPLSVHWHKRLETSFSCTAFIQAENINPRIFTLLSIKMRFSSLTQWYVLWNELLTDSLIDQINIIFLYWVYWVFEAKLTSLNVNVLWLISYLQLQGSNNIITLSYNVPGIVHYAHWKHN